MLVFSFVSTILKYFIAELIYYNNNFYRKLADWFGSFEIQSPYLKTSLYIILLYSTLLYESLYCEYIKSIGVYKSILSI